MRSDSLDYRRVLHVSDPAFTASLLREAAQRSGRHWGVLPVEPASEYRSPFLRTVDRIGRGARWEVQFAVQKTRYHRIHLHSALALPHLAWALGEYALHLHGTDIRTRRYEPKHMPTILNAVSGASTVFYSTPDLREHVAPIRPDAHLVPVPVRSHSPTTPSPRLRITGPYVFFPSRWEGVKGGQKQIESAALLRRAVTPKVELIGLDWGPMAGEARRAGVRLVPKQTHEQFLALIGGAELCIGQMAGILSASELESLAANVPTVAPLNPNWYDKSDPSLRDVPVLGGTDLASERDIHSIVDLALTALRHGSSNVQRSSEWVEQHHSPEAALNRVLSAYRSAGW